MQQRLMGLLNNIKEKWNELDRPRKIKLIITIAAAAAVMGTLIFIATKPKMTLVVENLTYNEIREAENILDDAGIYYELKNGNVWVKDSDAERTMVELVDQEFSFLSSDKDNSFANAMGLIGMGTTESVKESIERNQTEEKLANMLLSFDGISKAKVTLTPIKDDRYFIKNNEYNRAQASVTVTTTRDFTSKEKQNLANFMLTAVKGLDKENLSIMNHKMEMLFSGADTDDASGTNRTEIEQYYTSQMENAVKGIVQPLYSDVRVVVNLDIDFDTMVESAKEYAIPHSDQDAQTGLVDNESKRTSSVAGGNAGDEAGIGANDNAAPNYEMGENEGYNANEKTTDSSYLYNEYQTQKQKAGHIVNYENSGMSVIAYKDKYYYEELMTDEQLGTLSWVEFKQANEEMTLIDVDESIITAIKTGTKIPNVEVLAYVRPVFMDEIAEPMQIYHYAVFIILALLILLLLYGLVKKTQPDEITEVEPELSVEDLLVSTQLEEEASEAERLKDIAFNQESESKLQIEKFIDEKPEAVAQLLRNWLNEDWE